LTRSSALALVAFPVSFFAATNAFANPRPLPFTYPHEQLAEGATELEQFADFRPVRALDSQGAARWYGLTEFQTEFEHGLTDRLELGLYLTYAPSAASGFSLVPESVNGNGLKQRLRYKLADTGAWPIDVSLYGELVENEREIEVEGKVILQKRFGPMRIMANMTAEQENYFDGHAELVLAPSGGLTFEVTPSFHPGIEWWMRYEIPEKEEDAGGVEEEHATNQYVGPAVMAQFGELWWTNGFYVRVSEFGDHPVPGTDGFGRVWFRSVIGIGL